MFLKKKDESQALMDFYQNMCGDHCSPYFILEKLTISDFEREWSDESLSDLINSKTILLGCIPCDWKSSDVDEGKALLKKLISTSLLMEYPPFGLHNEYEASSFINRLFELIGEGFILTNTTKFGSSLAFQNIFPEHEKYDLDMGVAIISGEWFAFIAHRGFD